MTTSEKTMRCAVTAKRETSVKPSATLCLALCCLLIFPFLGKSHLDVHEMDPPMLRTHTHTHTIHVFLGLALRSTQNEGTT